METEDLFLVFTQNWLRRCEEIKKNCISPNEASHIQDQFNNELVYLLMGSGNKGHNVINETEQVKSELITALAIAKSKYDLNKKSIFNNILKHFHIHTK